jgi:hypothetical protein
MTGRIKNTIGLRANFEKRGLGLNASGSYVLATLDAGELKHLESVEFRTMEHRPEECVLVVEGTRHSGTLVRIVQLSTDGRYCYFPGRFRWLSPRLLKTTPLTIPDFIKSIESNPTVKIRKIREQRDRTGILVGLPEAKYKSLISLDGDRLVSVDIEENPPSQATHEVTRILEWNPAEGEEIRRRIILTGTNTAKFKPKASVPS